MSEIDFKLDLSILGDALDTALALRAPLVLVCPAPVDGKPPPPPPALRLRDSSILDESLPPPPPPLELLLSVSLLILFHFPRAPISYPFYKSGIVVVCIIIQ